MLDYVDDFIGICPEHLADFLWKLLLDLLDQLGVKPSSTPGHLVPPSAQFVGLGVHFDLDSNIISIPLAKLEDLLLVLHNWSFKTRASRVELQSLLGKLLQVCRVIRSGRLQLSRMLDTLRRCLRSRSPVSLDENFRLDLGWWTSNITGWNGVSFLEFVDQHYKITLDASSHGALGGGPGLGGFNHVTNHWFKCALPSEFDDWFIADLELLAHIVCFRLWSSQWFGLQVSGLTDSEPCELLLRHGRSRINRRLAMARAIASMEHQLSFQWISGGIRSADNVLADCASRWGDPERRTTFWLTCSESNIVPVEDSVSSLMWSF
jgi:hypothetical protein